LVSFAIVVSPLEAIPTAHGRAAGTLYHGGLWQLFQLLARGLVNVFFSRGFSHTRLIHFLFNASEVARCHESKGITGQFGTQLAISELSSYAEQF